MKAREWDGTMPPLAGENPGEPFRRAVAGAALVIATSVMTKAVRAVRQNKPADEKTAEHKKHSAVPKISNAIRAD